MPLRQATLTPQGPVRAAKSTAPTPPEAGRRQPAPGTTMHTNGQRLADFTAAQTVLTRSDWIYLYDSPPSLCRFDGELVEKGMPARIVNRLGKKTFGHAA